MIHINNKNEFDKIIKNDLVLVDFYATWCGPCQMLSPLLEELEQEEKNLTIAKVDVDKVEDLARSHSVMSIPTIEIYKKGKLINKVLGYQSKEELKDLIK